MEAAAVRIGLLIEAKPRVRVDAGDRKYSPRLRQAIPLAEDFAWTIQQRRHRLWSAQQVTEQCPRNRQACLVAPLAVAVDPFESVDRRVPEIGRASCRERV